MTSPPAIARTALSGKEWRVLILLVISALINYIDRTTLSVAATDIQRELHLTNTQVGALQSAFFATYALCQLSFVAGWVVGRFHVGWVLASGFLLWSGATAMTVPPGSSSPPSHGANTQWGSASLECSGPRAVSPPVHVHLAQDHGVERSADAATAQALAWQGSAGPGR